MFKLIIICCALLFTSVKASQLEDHCVIAHLKQKNLLNATTYTNYRAPNRAKNCTQVVKNIVKRLYEENYDYVEDDANVDNTTYRSCLQSEFDRNRMDEKFLKDNVFDDDEPGKMKLLNIIENLLGHIKMFCSRVHINRASQRFKEFVTDAGGLSRKLKRHPAIQKIKQNLVCSNLYAVEEKILDPSVYNLKLKPINNRSDGYCKQVLDDVAALIMDEWHIRRYSEDDKIQRCYIEILLQTQAVDSFIKNSLLSQLQLTQEQKDSEHEKFIESSSIVHEMLYKCMSAGFEKI